MSKLNAEWCKNHIESMKDNGMSLLEEKYLSALEIALPILEQQERSGCPPARDENASFELLPGESEYDRLNRMYEWMKAKPALGINLAELERQGDWIDWGGGDCPVFHENLVEIKMRNGATDGPKTAGKLCWHNGNAVRDEMGCDIIAYRIIPEQPTNQNGEQ